MFDIDKYVAQRRKADCNQSNHRQSIIAKIFSVTSYNILSRASDETSC